LPQYSARKSACRLLAGYHFAIDDSALAGQSEFCVAGSWKRRFVNSRPFFEKMIT